MLQSDAQEDLRLSIGAQAKEMPPPMLRDRANTFNTKQDSRQQEPAPVFDSPETELLSQLEKSRQEYEQLRCEKDKLERVQQQQHLHTTIEMRESIELLNEESLIKNEMLGKYEKEHQKLTDEVSSPIFIYIIISCRPNSTKIKTRSWWDAWMSTSAWYIHSILHRRRYPISRARASATV